MPVFNNAPTELEIPGRKGLQTFVILIGIPPAILAMGAFASGSVIGTLVCGGIAAGIWTLASKIKTVRKAKSQVTHY